MRECECISVVFVKGKRSLLVCMRGKFELWPTRPLILRPAPHTHTHTPTRPTTQPHHTPPPTHTHTHTPTHTQRERDSQQTQCIFHQSTYTYLTYASGTYF